jgi:hypothetical protein
MTIKTQTTFNFSVDIELIAKTTNAAKLISSPYAEGGYCPEYATYSPTLPDNVYPPPSGTYIGTKEWTDLTQAQQFSAQMNSWLDANPECKAYSSGPTVLVE